MSVRAREAAAQAAEQAARRRQDRNVLLAVMLTLVVLVVAGGIGFQAYRTKRAPTTAPDVAAAVSEAPQTVTDGQPLRFGAEAAPATVTLYEDFHCPHCADFETELGPTLTTAVAEGTTRLELYPMSFIDASSSAAANAVGCAGEAGFAFPFYLGLFANPALEWNDAQLVDLASLVGAAPTDAFTDCVTSRANAGWVTSVNATADAKGVTQTPTMFLDGAPVALEGLTPAKLQALIDAASGAK
ncbi:DsbA family protein [uncultured Friedmanniella sp.]|uniref:DsbA family protein n=1 Tax=uncultured Friedmanniella sp. TaxID=335381 RepID=UPI0035CB0D92